MNDIDFQCYGDELSDDITYSDEYIKAAELVKSQDAMDKATIKEKAEIEKKQLEARIKAAEQERIRQNKAYEDEERRRYEQLKAKFENK